MTSMSYDFFEKSQSLFFLVHQTRKMHETYKVTWWYYWWSI